MKKNRKTIVVLALFLGLLCYTVFALSTLPAAPVETDFADQALYEEALTAHEARVKQTHAYLTIGLLIVGALGFALEAAPVAVIAMVMPIYLGLSGILDFSQAFSGFANSTVILFAGLFILGAWAPRWCVSSPAPSASCAWASCC